MNNARRKAIRELVVKLEKLNEELDALKDEEQESYDNLSESLQSSPKGEASQTAIDELDSAHGTIEQTVMSLQTAIGE